MVDAERYTGWKQRARTEEARVCVGWSGSPSTAANLRLIEEPLREWSRRHDVRLVFIGAGDTALSGVSHASIPWRAETEVEDLRRLDVGLVPVPATRWAPHKFYLKLVQYMALGIPPVATPLGSNPIVIEDGVSGFLAANDAAWDDAVSRLAGDPDLRERVGKRAAEVAHERYTLQANAERIVDAFRSAVA